MRQPKENPETHSVRRTIWRGLRHLRETGDRLTGGGLRNLAQRSLRRVRDAGDRLTSAGLRALGKRILTASLLRTLRQRPALKELGCGVSQALPRSSETLCRLDDI